MMCNMSTGVSLHDAYLFCLLLSQHFHLVISNLNIHLFTLFTSHTNQLHLMSK